MFFRFVSLANQVRLFDNGFAWILTERIFSPSPDSLYNVPYGMLAIEGYETNNYHTILHNMVLTIYDAVKTFTDISPQGSTFHKDCITFGGETEYFLR